jgi:Rrf2 family transcriptional regulator, iron-sulfur cluster assembly transcription factor
MSLGRRADYAIRATLDLAGSPGVLRKSREIGEAMHIPVSFLPQILAQLVREGIVTSTAGPRGGYGLLRDPADLTLLDVVTAVEGAHEDADCVLRGGPCRWDDCCAVHVPWSRAKQAMLDELAATSFASLLESDRLLASAVPDVPEVPAVSGLPREPAAEEPPLAGAGS